ncbi:cleft lip and palate transmembrane 1 [Coccomyxa subellipsoidea C-169]|uniref:Cleft lip and palate transmembrane 1 n=1 Tax=Coccomyxa subellipsoidea (strain C-169) TaxID=574566 RepID=I0YKL9_COCSC|nr:cleft lip and palate transmembrane 1 [Coccomyxa subellipsoidea C-169]EIE18938.1 cleft lip and palate transmembrane 1 [Coccomyxa subellipsoidea C-169]|eukprot:XP_005643482.1 cleft lip and palate transmembrane 1 [Coccomyxa subellipsoidea C-169]
MLVPQFQRGTHLDLYVFLSEQPSFSQYSDSKALVWAEKDFALGTEADRKLNITYHPSEAVQNNGTVYLHAFFAPTGVAIDPTDPFYKNNTVFSKSAMLNRYLPRPKNKTGVNLLATTQAEQVDARKADKEEAAKPAEYISFIKPYVSIALIDDATAYPANAVPDHIKEYLDVDFDMMTYKPSVFFNDFWMLRDTLVPVNETLSEVQVALDLHQMALWKFTIYAQMEKSFQMQRDMGMQADGESDELKRVLLEGNPIFLAITFAVSMLHSVFDVLAFKNDIGFWRNKKSVEGLSVRTVGINCFCQVVIMLYLLEENTSYVVLFSSGLGLIIEFWKLTQAMSISLDTSCGYPRLRFADKSSYSESKTKQYDAEAMRYLSYALFPLVAAYSVYTLLYQTHRSWYSWVLNTLVGAVYTFGFVLMCPQLYLNYRMKSVAHLPWRQLTYKFLNTIIDDLFAFVIKMPTLHRLSVFRDDIVFLIFLYQKWIYGVDKKRANEFGFSAEEPAAEQGPITDGTEAAAPSTSAVPAEAKKDK